MSIPMRQESLRKGSPGGNAQGIVDHQVKLILQGILYPRKIQTQLAHIPTTWIFQVVPCGFPPPSSSKKIIDKPHIRYDTCGVLESPLRCRCFN